jgi:hypothetical protein
LAARAASLPLAHRAEVHDDLLNFLPAANETVPVMAVIFTTETATMRSN